MELLIGGLAAWGLIMLVWVLAGLLLLPLRGKLPVVVILRCSGDNPWLERYIQGLLWLRDSGLIWWRIVIYNEGLGPDGLEQAACLAQQHGLELLDQTEMMEWVKSEDESA